MILLNILTKWMSVRLSWPNEWLMFKHRFFWPSWPYKWLMFKHWPQWLSWPNEWLMFKLWLLWVLWLIQFAVAYTCSQFLFAFAKSIFFSNVSTLKFTVVHNNHTLCNYSHCSIFNYLLNCNLLWLWIFNLLLAHCVAQGIITIVYVT